MNLVEILINKYPALTKDTPLVDIPSIVTADEWAELYLELKYGLNNVENIVFGEPPNEPHDPSGKPLE